MNPSDAASARIRRALAEQRTAAELSIDELERSIHGITGARQDSNSDDEHDPEGVTLAYERSQADALLTQARGRLVDVDAALARLEAGVYGTCERCGDRIAPARLKARPAARRCITCASLR
jgi:DnaK suppressor protein